MTGEGITDEGLMGLFEPVDKTSARFWQDELVLLASVFCCCCLLNLNDHDKYLQTFVSLITPAHIQKLGEKKA